MVGNNITRASLGSVGRDGKRAREVVARQAEVRDEVRLACLKVDGAVALGGHIMQRVVALDELRMTLSQGDPVTNALLSDIEANTVRQAKGLQNGLFDAWGLR